MDALQYMQTFRMNLLPLLSSWRKLVTKKLATKFPDYTASHPRIHTSVILTYIKQQSLKLCFTASRGKVKVFFSTPKLRNLLWSPPNLLSNIYWGSPGVERPGCEADKSYQYSAEVKYRGAILSIPQYPFMACCLIN